MTIRVFNQAPSIFSPLYKHSPKGDFNPVEILDELIIENITLPINPANPVLITDDGIDLDDSQLTDLFTQTLGDSLDTDAEDKVKDLLSQTNQAYSGTSPLYFSEFYPVQAGEGLKYPHPTVNTIYTPRTDIIPAAKAVIANSTSSPYAVNQQPITATSEFFVSLAYTYSPRTLGVYFRTEDDFDEFKEYVSQQATLLSSILPAETTNLCTQFSQLKLKGLTESILLRNDVNDANHEYSFARIIISFLMEYLSNVNTDTNKVGLMPFNVNELIIPKSLVFVNVEAHARARANRINKEWKIIEKSLAKPIKIISNRALTKLTATQRAATKAQQAAAQQQHGVKLDPMRSASIRFRRQRPSRGVLLKDITYVLRRMKQVNYSQNIYRSTKTSFARANRRDPLDYNKPGKITSTQYLPDLHIYVDTSGSISEDNYQEAILTLITIAKKLNVNIYFNSFSHVLSQEVLLKTANKSINQIWNEFRRVPKVTGMTDYLQIYEYINRLPVRKRRMNVIITDFEWYPPTHRFEHPTNLYYAPCSNMDWQRIVSYAKEFERNMSHVDPSISQKLLGMLH